MKAISCGLLGASAALAVAAAVLAIRDGAPSSPSLSVEGAEQELNDITVGTHELTIALTNRSDRPLQVMGMAPACGNNCCLDVKHWQHVTVEPWETYRYTYDVRVHEPGPFEAETSIYLEGDGVREVHLTVRGIAASPPAKTGDQKPALN